MWLELLAKLAEAGPHCARGPAAAAAAATAGAVAPIAGWELSWEINLRVTFEGGWRRYERFGRIRIVAVRQPWKVV